MPKINKYVDIDEVEREARKDYIDRHSPFISMKGLMNKGEKKAIKVTVGKEYEHPDDFDHYIASVSLFDGETLLAKADFLPGTLGGDGEKGQAEVDFNIVTNKSKLKLVAHAYCTKHGIWESKPLEIKVN